MDGKPSAPTGLVLLGATGTIGRLTLEVAARHAQRYRIVGLAAGRNADLLAEQAIRFQPEAVALATAGAADEFARQLAGRWRGEILAGDDACARLAGWPGAGIVVNGMVGAAGLSPSLAAIAAGRRLALANKESLVAGGHLVRRALERHGGTLIPIDSEHSAIFQCLHGREQSEVSRIILTASGGPFRDWPAARIAQATPDLALRHPTWQMGPRITVDAATLFNKGMEVIEARWLFDVPDERIDVLIHPQSIVHGLVELSDGALVAHLSLPDMRGPILYALAFPERLEPGGARCDLATLERLTFSAPDEARFPCLRIVREAGALGGTLPAACNAADERLVAAFLAREIPYGSIPIGLEYVLARHRTVHDPSLDEIMAADSWAREEAEAFIRNGQAG